MPADILTGGVERAKKIQFLRLQALAEHCAGWGVLVYFENIPGDVSFLAPICPRLRGYEIVCANSAGTYDIWRRSRIGKLSMTRHNNMDLEQIGAWLKDRSPPESEYLKHAATWATQTMEFYGVPRRKAAEPS